ncbi:MAG: dihydroneopterin aldolase [Verrucomicrobia bacterium]|nr:dihydroneopterin aldolase [Verrucomicrobiota bacterium]
MDRITIRDLEVWYRVGVGDEERANPQRLHLSLEMTRDLRAAGVSDDLADTIDYFAVAQRLMHFGEDKDWKLIEKVAADVASMVLDEFGPVSVAVEVKKFILPETNFVSVRLTRDAQGRPLKPGLS